MLWTIFVILLVLWLLGLVSSYTLGGFIHILLVIAVVVLLFGGSQLPKLARSMGSASKEFRKGLEEGEPEKPTT